MMVLDGLREDWIRALLWKRDLTLTAPSSDRSSNVNSACELKNKPDKYFSFFLSFFFGGGGEGGFEGAEDSLASHLREIENLIVTS